MGFRRLDQPGKGAIRALLADDEGVYFAGASGMCGRLDARGVARYDAPADHEYYAVARFDERIFIGAGRKGLDVLEDRAAANIKPNVSSYHLTARDGYLFIGGASEAVRYDGTAWLATDFTPG